MPGSKSNLWQITALVEQDQVEPVEQKLEDTAIALSRFEALPDGSLWRIEALFESEPNQKYIARLLRNTDFQITMVTPRDWVSESQALLPPIAAGRFYLHGSHDPAHALPHIYDLLIEAGQAFGTGRHETTKACLLLLDRLLQHRHPPRRVLDLGCGSGILALAFAKASRRYALGSDIDPIAVQVARNNAYVNHLGPLFKAITAVGFRHQDIRRATPFDLIFANILARPLVQLAPEIAQHLAPGGRAILSGLLQIQEPMVLNAARRAGLKLERRLRLGDWSALLVARPAV